MSLILPSRRGLLTGASALAAMALLPSEEAWAQRQQLRFAAANSAPAAVTLDPAFLDAAHAALSGGNLTVTCTSAASQSVRSTKAIPNSGAFWEMTITVGTNACGVLDSTEPAAGTVIGADLASGGVLTFNGSTFYNGSTSGLGCGAIAASTVLLMLYRPVAKTFHIFIPGFGWDAGGTGDPVADTGGQSFGSIGATVYAGVSCINNTDAAAFNFGATTFSNTAAVSTLTGAGFQSLTNA